jgi:hypothetical protein
VEDDIVIDDPESVTIDEIEKEINDDLEEHDVDFEDRDAIKTIEAILIAENSVCNVDSVELGDHLTLEECSQLCIWWDSCEFFVFYQIIGHCMW